MGIRRIVPNLPARDPQALAAFFCQVFGIETVMDGGFIVTLAGSTQNTQLNLAAEGGAGTDIPAISVEVDDLDETHARALLIGADIVYGPVEETWGVRRFYLRDPEGNLINILTHSGG